ncbi:hypothetical protein M9H77_19413 [Catharanthus roseus]|uniref:Uncharacterized protein n=1 Tax=Catharanthus roseus TaxID=4058 RepID=A0ACC0BA88_CATRO|nr:hypothetical protein M9H77_19413 [Catharanthus roseus]
MPGGPGSTRPAQERASFGEREFESIGSLRPPVLNRLSVFVFWSSEIITVVSEPRLTKQPFGYHSSSDPRGLGKGKTLNLPFYSKIKSHPQSVALKSIWNLGRAKCFLKNLVMHTVASLCI